VQRLLRLNQAKALGPQKHDRVGLSNHAFLAPGQVAKALGPGPSLKGLTVASAKPAQGVAVAPNGSFKRTTAKGIGAKAGTLEGAGPNDSWSQRCGDFCRSAAPDGQGCGGESAQAPGQGGRALEARPPARGSTVHRVGVAK
jgi:hypothetical protein